MKLIYVSAFLFLVACVDSDSIDSGTQNFEALDSIKEFEMNEGRLTAVDFNNELTLMQERMLDLMTELFQSDSSNIDLNLENTLFELEVNLQNIDLMFKASVEITEFARCQRNLIKFYTDELNGKFKEIIPLLKESNLTKKQKDELNNYDIYFVEQEKIWFDSVFVAQEKFAKANNIMLQE